MLSREQLVRQFEEASSAAYPSEVRIATLWKCSGQKLREYLHLTINEQTTYSHLKLLKSLQGFTATDQGPQPMEVDRAENKAKGKHKGKNKDKGKNWWNYGTYGAGNAFGRGRGRGKGDRSNKGKGKGKQTCKPKSKRKTFGTNCEAQNQNRFPTMPNLRGV